MRGTDLIDTSQLRRLTLSAVALAALVVDEVLGFRRFTESEFSGAVPVTIVPCARFLAGSFHHESEQWPVLSLRRLLEDPSFAQAAA